MQQSSYVSARTKRAIFGCAGLAFCGVLVETSLNVTFPTLMEEFGVTLNMIQWVTTAYLLAVAATMVVAGFVQRNLKLRTIITVGGVAFVAGGVMCALASSLPFLITGRIIQAIGTGFTMPLVFALIMRKVPSDSQGKFNGTAGMLIALAPSLGPTYGGIVSQLLSWRLIFWIVLPIGIISSMVAFSSVEQSEAPAHETFPFVQFILLLAALILIALGFNSTGTSGFGAPQFYLPLIIAIALLYCFFKAAAKSKAPLIHVNIFKNKMFSKILTIYFTIQFIQIGLTFVLPNFAQLALGKSASISGMLLLAGSLVSAVLSPLSGRYLDSVGIEKPLRIGSIFLVVSLLSFVLFAKNLSTILLAVFYIIYMIGFSLMFNNSLTFGLQSLSFKEIGDGNAAFNTLQQYAGSLGTAIMAALLAMGSQIHPDWKAVDQTVSGNRITLIFSLVVILLVAILAFSVKSSKRKEE